MRKPFYITFGLVLMFQMLSVTAHSQQSSDTTIVLPIAIYDKILNTGLRAIELDSALTICDMQVEALKDKIHLTEQVNKEINDIIDIERSRVDFYKEKSDQLTKEVRRAKFWTRVTSGVAIVAGLVAIFK